MLKSVNLRKGFAAVLSLLLLIPGSQGLQAQSMSVVDLNMTVGKSLVIDYPVEIGRISTSSPEVVDAVPATSKEFLLHGKGHGSATVVVWAKNGARTMYNVTVEHNTEPLKKILSETFPSEDIRIQSARDSITLVGRVSSKEVADRAIAIATPMAKTVVSNLAVSAAPVEKQIMLKVKFAEVNRNKIQQFGVNLLSTGAGNTPGRLTTGQFSGPNISSVSGEIGGGNLGSRTTFSLSDALNIFAFRPDLNLGAVIRAMQNEDILQILAEPNLVTLNGKEASFLVGGEFPVPILQGGGNAGAVTIQFREFGIRLTFNPQITGNGTIRMYVKPEVSTIDLANAVQLQGFTIPALATRRMETNVELKQGQSFVVAGLIDDRVTDQMSRIPGLSNIPILGTIFKSRNERRSKSELVVLVTPELVEPLDAGQKAPLPDFPREFLKTSKLDPTKSAPADADAAKNVNAKNDAAAEKTDGSSSDSSAWKNVFFWRGGKKGAQATTDVKAAETEALKFKVDPPKAAEAAASAPAGEAATNVAVPTPEAPIAVGNAPASADAVKEPVKEVKETAPTDTVPAIPTPASNPSPARAEEAAGRPSTLPGKVAEKAAHDSPVKVIEDASLPLGNAVASGKNGPHGPAKAELPRTGNPRPTLSAIPEFGSSVGGNLF